MRARFESLMKQKQKTLDVVRRFVYKWHRIYNYKKHFRKNLPYILVMFKRHVQEKKSEKEKAKKDELVRI